MKNKTRIRQLCLLAVLASLAGLAENARAELRVLKPSGGAIPADSTYQVLWQSSSPADDVRLTLMQGERAIGSPVRLRGRLERENWIASWAVPRGVAAGVYHIRLQNRRAHEQAVSRLFKISARRPDPGDRPESGITLTGFPTAGEIVYATHQRWLTWRGPERPGGYRVRLLKHSRHVNHLTSDESHNDRFNWTIGRNYAPGEPTPTAGMGYNLVVESMDESVRQVSPSFTIRWPTIQILEPTGTTRIRGDRSNRIRWTSTNLQGGVRISLELRSNARRRTTIDFGSGENSGSVTKTWMDEYTTRRNNWESGTGRIVVRSVRAPAIHAATPEFRTGNTSMPSEE